MTWHGPQQPNWNFKQHFQIVLQWSQPVILLQIRSRQSWCWSRMQGCTTVLCSVLCYDVIGCWLWNTWVRTSLNLRAERCTFVLVNSDQLRFVSYLLVSVHLCCPLIHLSTTDTLLTLFFLLQQRTASLSQLPVEDLRDPLPPHWRCYMSPQGRRYYVNTASNGKATVCVHC